MRVELNEEGALTRDTIHKIKDLIRERQEGVEPHGLLVIVLNKGSLADESVYIGCNGSGCLDSLMLAFIDTIRTVSQTPADTQPVAARH